MRNLFKKFEKLHKSAKSEKDFDKALRELKRIESKYPLTPKILVMKGDTIQLSSENSPYELDDAEKAFKKALEIDSEYQEALTELGWYYLYVFNSAKRALPYFKKAFELSRGKLAESIQGIAECTMKMESPQKAKEFVKNSVKSCINKEKVKKILKTINKETKYYT